MKQIPDNTLIVQFKLTNLSVRGDDASLVMIRAFFVSLWL